MALRRLAGMLSIVLAVPFLAYGVVGLMRWAGVDRFLSNVLGVRLSEDPVTALGYIAVGCGVYFLLRLAAEKV